ncbi:MAG: NYN domain-containing protein [Armatimonadota bacterium]
MANVYVAVDVQNLETSAEEYGQTVPIGAILDRVKVEGYPVVLKAYADWAEPRIRDRMAEYQAYGFELVQLMSNSRGKNAGDIMLVLDVMESLHLPECPDVYVVVSGDGDFVPLAPKLRRKLKQFIAMGFGASSNTLLQGLCDQFIFLDALVADFEQKRRVKYQIPSSDEPAAAAPASPEQEIIDEEPEVVSPVSTVNDHPEPIYAEPPRIIDSGIPEPDYTDVKQTALYYRRVLQEYKRVRVESFYHREKLVKRAWDILEDDGGYVPLQDLFDELRDFADYNSYGIYPRGIEVILRTLYIARCFDLEGESHGFSLQTRVCPGPEIDASTALDMMNETYVRGLTMALPDIHLELGGLAHLLMDKVTPETTDKTREIIKKVRPFFGEPTALGQAFEEAQGPTEA